MSADATMESGRNVWTSYSTRDRTLLASGAIVSYLIFSLVGRLCGIPPVLKYGGSLFAQPSILIAAIVVGITLVACVLIGSLIAGSVHFEGGLFCAALGMLSLSIRGGSTRYVLMYATSSGVYVRMACELIMLCALMGIAWYALQVLKDMNLLHGEPLREDDPDAMPAQGVMSMGASVIIMLFLMLLFCQSDQKAQVVWSVAISSMVATVAAHSLFPARPSLWFWLTPFAVGVIGYVLAWAGGSALVGGQVGGILPQLARPLPLDYAGAGTAGALLGYWTSRKWLHEREHEPHTTGEVEEAVDQVS